MRAFLVLIQMTNFTLSSLIGVGITTNFTLRAFLELIQMSSLTGVCTMPNFTLRAFTSVDSNQESFDWR